jgi:site-specific DNA-methyltransferase (adenine-specific)
MTDYTLPAALIAPPPGAAQVTATRLAVHYSSATGDWNTPRALVDAIVAFWKPVGAIGLDPCADSYETPHVPAVYRFAPPDDGLARDWYAQTVYMNPPYGRTIDRWVAKLVEEWQAGHCLEALALLPNRPDTRWYRRLETFPILHIAGRLHFGDGPNPAPFPSALAYLPPRLVPSGAIAHFAAHFAPWGAVWVRYGR